MRSYWRKPARAVWGGRETALRRPPRRGHGGGFAVSLVGSGYSAFGDAAAEENQESGDQPKRRILASLFPKNRGRPESLQTLKRGGRF